MKQTTDTTPAQSDSALREEKILELWDKAEIFKKALSKESPKGEFIFYEGPPTANGLPHMGHLEGRAFKDVFPRYKTMCGYHVRRKGGWDTHGLPVEIEVEKQLGLTNKKQIEEYGIAAFNAKCKESVWKYVDEWLTFSRRIGYWLDFENAYVTYYPAYIESLWNIVKEIHSKELLYRDYKVVPWCPRCGTGLSSHELAQGYADVQDTSVYIKFRSLDTPNEYFVAWTTTPWTLPGNVALAVGEDISYVKVQVDNDTYWVAQERANTIFPEGNIVEEVKGKELIGRHYEPLFPFFADSLPEKEKDKLSKAYQVYPADFVSTGDGTGIVHTAVMYGAEDFELGNAVGLPKHHLVGEDGKFTNDVIPYAGVFVKSADKKIIEDLEAAGLLLKTEVITHTYPFCWRCKTPLIYYARHSWYIKMSALRDKLIKENEKINWVPSHIREGRFGQWLADIKDWAISRDRYWGTPLPVWHCAHCGEEKVIGSIKELQDLQKSSGNTYFVMRHGEAQSNVQDVMNSISDAPDHLTERGKEEVVAAAKELQKKDIDLIISSPFVRTRETAQIIQEVLRLSSEDLILDKRLGEVQTGIFNGKLHKEYDEFFASDDWFTKRPEGGESPRDVKVRMGECLYDIDSQYKDKKILIVTHGGPARQLFSAAGVRHEHFAGEKSESFNTYAELHELPFVPLPHNEEYEVDLHKPYIDEVVIPCPKCEAAMQRTPEVMDVWFDSGAMPFAQDHYPFENKEWIENTGFPAQYICEGLDQTRGWFYTLHAIGALMGRGRAYENVICLGLIMDAKGKKMSKSVGNVVSPMDVIPKYGADVLRFWMYSVNQPGDSKNFDEVSVADVMRKVFTILRNVVNFYELYAPEVAFDESARDSKHVLDRWIISKLDELTQVVTQSMDSYDVFTSTHAIRDFIGELSTWYIRRSRDRFKGEDESDKKYALATTRYVLLELSKIMAPFTPFFAEEIYQSLKKDDTRGPLLESVHLQNWPKAKDVDDTLLAQMEEARRLVTLALEIRSSAGIKVRQPLGQLLVRNPKVGIEHNAGVLEVLRDEINVKEVVFDDSEGWEIELDTEVTPELKKEGSVREIIRFIQDMRKKAGFSPHDTAILTINANDEATQVVNEYIEAIKQTAKIAEVRFGEVTSGDTLQIDTLSFTLAIEK